MPGRASTSKSRTRTEISQLWRDLARSSSTPLTIKYYIFSTVTQPATNTECLQAINTKPAVLVSAGESIVVYRMGDQVAGRDKKGDVERKLLHGPTQYIPHPMEWTHEFCWHGVDPLDKTHLIQGLNTFTKLRTIADQIYYNVRKSPQLPSFGLYLRWVFK